MSTIVATAGKVAAAAAAAVVAASSSSLKSPAIPAAPALDPAAVYKRIGGNNSHLQNLCHRGPS